MKAPNISEALKACEDYLKDLNQPEVKEYVLRGMISMLWRRWNAAESEQPAIIAGWGQESAKARQDRKVQSQRGPNL